MDIQYLKEFLVFSEELNYSSASKRLFLARTSLREHIAELEHELQVELVTKKPVGSNTGSGTGPAMELKLTYFGKLFVERARTIVQLADQTIDEFHALKDNTLCLTVNSTGLHWLRDVLFPARRNILARYPEKNIQIETVTGPKMTLQTLREGESDIAILRLSHGISPRDLPDDDNDLHFFKLCTTDILFFVNEGNSLFEKDVITLQDVAGMDLVVPQDVYSSYLASIPVDSFSKPVFRVASDAFTDYQEYYASNFSGRFGSIPRALLSHFDIDKRTDCRVFSIEDLPVRSDFYVVCLEDLLNDPTARLLFDEMETIVAASQVAG